MIIQLLVGSVVSALNIMIHAAVTMIAYGLRAPPRVETDPVRCCF